MNNPVVQPEARERKIILLLCLLAALHVFVFSAAFPFFSIVDEQMHFDLVVNYSQGRVPRQLAPLNDEALPFITIYETPEYLRTPSGQLNNPIPPPPWKLPMAEVQKKLVVKAAAYKNLFKNHEASQPPLYYTVAGAWWRLGKWLGLDGGFLLYWLRFLNIPLVVAIVWLGWLAAKKAFPENLFIRIAVPALITFMPQTIFYAISNDVFSPLTFGAAFVLLLAFWEAEIPSARLAAATGLALAATFLTKISNLPLLAVAGIVIALKIFLRAREGKACPAVSSLWFLFVCAGLPVVAWLAWCKSNFGDFTGSVDKIHFLGWTNRPVAEWFHHPIFTASGFWFFLKGNLSTFWQGELLWHRQPLAFPAADLMFVLLTLALLVLAMMTLLKRPAPPGDLQRVALWSGFGGLAAMFAFFALLSVKYDFQDCFYPSREHPFFTSGRLLLGLLIPTLMLLATGFDFALKHFATRTKFVVLATLLLFMLAAEVAVDWKIFPNEYNWFHL